MLWNIQKLRSFQGHLCKKGVEWHFCIAGVLTHCLSISDQSCCGLPFLSAASALGLPAGGRDTDSSWTGQGDNAPLLQQPVSSSARCNRGGSQAKSKCRLKASLGETVAGLCSFTGQKPSWEGPGARWAWQCCVPATQKAEHLQG